MTIDEWGDWSQYHQTLFFMTSPDDAALVRLWREMLIGYEFADLRTASQWIASNKAAAFRTQHLQLLQERVRLAISARNSAIQAASRSVAEEADQRSRCVACPGTGIVEVPLPEDVVDGEWIPYGRAFRVTGVFCLCGRGEYRYQNFVSSMASRQKLGRPLTLLEYEHTNPDWREQFEARDAALKATKQQAALAGHLDRTRPLLKSVTAAVTAAQTSTAPDVGDAYEGG